MSAKASYSNEEIEIYSDYIDMVCANMMYRARILEILAENCRIRHEYSLIDKISDTFDTIYQKFADMYKIYNKFRYIYTLHILLFIFIVGMILINMLGIYYV